MDSYELKYDGLYFWSQAGVTAEAISSKYTSPEEANIAMNLYMSGKKFVADKMTGEEDLEELNSKASLVGYAEALGVEIPAKLKQPSAIKKYLKGLQNA